MCTNRLQSDRARYTAIRSFVSCSQFGGNQVERAMQQTGLWGRKESYLYVVGRGVPVERGDVDRAIQTVKGRRSRRELERFRPAVGEEDLGAQRRSAQAGKPAPKHGGGRKI